MGALLWLPLEVALVVDRLLPVGLPGPGLPGLLVCVGAGVTVGHLIGTALEHREMDRGR
jgi:hypothetical protein